MAVALERRAAGHRVGPGAPAQAVGAAVTARAVRAIAGAAAPSAAACAAACCYCANIAGGTAACDIREGEGRGVSAFCARVRSARGHGRSGSGRARARGDGVSARLGRMCQGARARGVGWGLGQAPRSPAEWVDGHRSAPARQAPGAARAACSAAATATGHVAASRCQQRPCRRIRPRLPGYLRRGQVVECWRGAAGGARRARRGGGARWRDAAGWARRAGRGGRGAVGGAHGHELDRLVDSGALVRVHCMPMSSSAPQVWSISTTFERRSVAWRPPRPPTPTGMLCRRRRRRPRRSRRGVAVPTMSTPPPPAEAT